MMNATSSARHTKLDTTETPINHALRSSSVLSLVVEELV